MIVKLNQVLQSAEALKFVSSVPLDATTAFRVAKFLRKLQDEVDAYMAALKNIGARLGEPDGKGSIAIPPERAAEFQIEHDALLSIEIELPDFSLRVRDFRDAKIPPMHLVSLHWLLSE